MHFTTTSMASRDLLFDSFSDKGHLTYPLHAMAGPYDAYPINGSQHSVSNLTPPFNGEWELDMRLASGRSRVYLNSYPHGAPISQSSYPREDYRSYISPYPSHELAVRPQADYQSTNHRAPMCPQLRNDDYIIHSTFIPDVAGFQPTVTAPPVPTSDQTRESTSWERSTSNGNLTSPAQSFGLESDSLPWSAPSDARFLTFDSRAWNDTILSSIDCPDPAPYVPSQEFTHQPSPVPSSSSSPLSHDVTRHVSPASSIASASPTSRRSSVDSTVVGKSCSHCHATSTPLWRREPTTLKPLCNACGLYLQQRNKHRPQELIDADAAADELSDSSDPDATGPECSHCRTHHTSVWRRSKTGAQLCNACGVYSRLRGRDRPLSLKRNRIKPRSKHTPR